MALLEESLFALLRIGLGLSEVDEASCKTLSILSDVEWGKLYELSNEQGVSGICFDALDKVIGQLKHDGGGPSMDLLMDWLGQTSYREEINRQQLTVTNKLAKLFSRSEINFVLMKGQANGLYYPNPFHREKGDIDCYLVKLSQSAYTEGNQIAKSIGLKVDESWYKHSVIECDGESIENHQFFVHTRDGKRGKNLDAALRELAIQDCYDHYPDTDICLPPVMFNALFLTYHALAHFVSEGMHLKQITDWVMFVNKEKDNIDWTILHSLCERFNLDIFLNCMNVIAEKYYGICFAFHLPECYYPLADKIIVSVMHDKDFVFGSGEGNWHNRWHLITNLFKYRWKYEEIYQTSIWKQIWYYATGFIFKTE